MTLRGPRRVVAGRRGGERPAACRSKHGRRSEQQRRQGDGAEAVGAAEQHLARAVSGGRST